MHDHARGEAALARALSALLVVASFLATDSLAAEWTGHAVIVGISDYEGTEYDLTWCDDDAREVYDTLLSDSAHWSTDNVWLFVDGEADYSTIATTISDEFDEATGADDVCLFFFSGHGTQVTDDDGDEAAGDNLDEALVLPDLVSRITDDDLATWFAAHDGKRICAVFDVCRAGGMAKSIDPSEDQWNAGLASDILKALPPATPGKTAVAATRDVNNPPAQDGIVMLMACEDVQLSEEDPILRNGVFSFFVIEALRSRAADADANTFVSAEEAFTYAYPLVVEWNPDQTPEIYDTHTGDLDIIAAADRPMDTIVEPKDFPFGGEGCSGGTGTGAGGTAPWGLAVAAGVAALVLLRRRREAGLAAVALLISPGCGGLPGREGGGLGLRAGLALPFAENAAPYSGGPQVGAYYRAPLVREGSAVEFGGDVLVIDGDGYDIEAAVLRLRGDVVLSMGDAASVWVPYLTVGGRFFSAGVGTYWGSGYDVAWGLGVALGIGRSGGGTDCRACLDWLPERGNIGAIFGLTAGWNF